MFQDSKENFVQSNVLIQLNLTIIRAVGNMSEIKLTIDDREILVPEGSTILEAARKAGSYVPALCDHPDLKPIGSCKLCIVSVEGLEQYPTACNTLAEEGMVVETTTPELQEMRRHTLEMLLALTNHPTSCLFCERKK